MKKLLITMMIVLIGTQSCKTDKEFLDVPPLSILTTDLVFSDPALALSVLGDLYNRAVDFSSLKNGWASFVEFSEAFPSDGTTLATTTWNYGTWGLYEYGYVRDLNLFIERLDASNALNVADKARFTAEARFLRAQYYFEMVKRMGGVPLITKSFIYENGANISTFQFPRAKESEIYDFVINEAEAIKGLLPSSSLQKSRATAAAALAMECRAALYAGSIARYGVKSPLVTLPNGEVGIPSNRAAGYYTIALNSAKAIINGSVGDYKLYTATPDLAENFAAIFYDKSASNKETIFIEDFKSFTEKTHQFTTQTQPFAQSEEAANSDAGRLNPSLNLVEAFEKLDNTYAPIGTRDDKGNPIYYTNMQDAFAGRDARLAGTIILPDALFKGKKVDIWAGYVLADGKIVSAANSSVLQTLPGTASAVQVVGADGPVDGLAFRTQTGFYIRKYLDPAPQSGTRGRGSDLAFIRYRLGEVLLNAAEAAFELGDLGTANLYFNQLRARAGLTTPFTLTSANGFDRIVHERRVELVFEGHTFFDTKRWRIANDVWDGTKMTVADLVANIGVATKRNTQPFGLYPYKLHNPGNPNHGKWTYREVLPGRVTGALAFRNGNYYSQIADNLIIANPKLVRQPNQ